ncbi:MAG: hypothetical protein KDD52_04065 [Bdellovibrionales bacterium]|nr:hypothetical protein [Bdellovibrionales bacterium]
MNTVKTTSIAIALALFSAVSLSSEAFAQFDKPYTNYSNKHKTRSVDTTEDVAYEDIVRQFTIDWSTCKIHMSSATNRNTGINCQTYLNNSSDYPKIVDGDADSITATVYSTSSNEAYELTIQSDTFYRFERDFVRINYTKKTVSSISEWEIIESLLGSIQEKE